MSSSPEFWGRVYRRLDNNNNPPPAPSRRLRNPPLPTADLLDNTDEAMMDDGSDDAWWAQVYARLDKRTLARLRTRPVAASPISKWRRIRDVAVQRVLPAALAAARAGARQFGRWRRGARTIRDVAVQSGVLPLSIGAAATGLVLASQFGPWAQPGPTMPQPGMPTPIPLPPSHPPGPGETPQPGQYKYGCIPWNEPYIPAPSFDCINKKFWTTGAEKPDRMQDDPRIVASVLDAWNTGQWPKMMVCGVKLGKTMFDGISRKNCEFYDPSDPSEPWRPGAWDKGSWLQKSTWIPYTGTPPAKDP